jgi:hypothetical protein
MTDTTKMAAHLWDADIQRNRADRLAAMVETRDNRIHDLENLLHALYEAGKVPEDWMI